MTPSVAPDSYPDRHTRHSSDESTCSPTTAPAIKPSEAPAAELPLRLLVPGFNPATSAFFLTMGNIELRRLLSLHCTFAFDRNIGCRLPRHRPQNPAKNDNALNLSQSLTLLIFTGMALALLRDGGVSLLWPHILPHPLLLTPPDGGRDGRISFYCALYFHPPTPSTPRGTLAKRALFHGPQSASRTGRPSRAPASHGYHLQFLPLSPLTLAVRRGPLPRASNEGLLRCAFREHEGLRPAPFPLPPRHLIPLFLQTSIHEVRIGLIRL